MTRKENIKLYIAHVYAHIYICIDVHESELSVPVACKSCSILNVCQRYAMVPGLARVTCWVIYMLMDRWESGFELAVLTE